jgi:hypothetical protein
MGFNNSTTVKASQVEMCNNNGKTSAIDAGYGLMLKGINRGLIKGNNILSTANGEGHYLLYVEDVMYSVIDGNEFYATNDTVNCTTIKALIEVSFTNNWLRNVYTITALTNCLFNGNNFRNNGTNEGRAFVNGWEQIGTKVTFNGTAAPTALAYVVGDKVINTAPTAGGYEGWVCVSAGTPGGWRGYGAIQA